MSEQLAAGVGMAVITPPPGIPQGGWGAQLHQRSQGNDLDLQARALVLEDSLTQCAVIDIDAIGFDQQTTARLISAIADLTGISHHAIRLSCTHTHSGPNTFRLGMITEGLDSVLAYLNCLPHQVAGAVWQAQRRMQPVRIAVSTGACDINVNRRCRDAEGRTYVGCNSSAPVDQTVTVLRLDTHDRRPIAAIMHYACHPTTMGWQNQLVTPDYPGQAKRIVEESLGAPCLFLQGCAGDLGPRRGFTGDLNVYRKLGTVLGLEAAKLAWNTDTAPTRLQLRAIQESGARIGIYDEVPLPHEPQRVQVIQEQVLMPVRKHPNPTELRERLQTLLQQVDQLRAENDEQALRDATAAATQMSMAVERAELFAGKATVPWPVQAISIGNIALLSMAGEPFSAIGLRIKQQSPFPHTLVSGYTNGGFGYIPVAEAFPEGGYEIETTPFSETAAEVMINSALGLLERLWRQHQ